jgi:hypothetical protein
LPEWPSQWLIMILHSKIVRKHTSPQSDENLAI